MNPISSVLLYSKFSNFSQVLMDNIEKSKIDFSGIFNMQTLCIDNFKIRERIKGNKQINISTVPSLLLIYNDGGIEKFDGQNIFEWFDNVIEKFKVPEPPIQQEIHAPVEEIQKPKQKSQHEIETEINRREFEKRMNGGSGINERDNEKVVENELNSTLIEDLPLEENPEDIKDTEEMIQDIDRYSSTQPKAQIRSNEGGYLNSENMFQGEPPDTRRPKKSAISNTSKGKDIMALAKEMEKGRA